MRLSEVWRFPVKSLQGERVSAAAVTRQGLAGDRGHAIFDVETGFGLTARRVPELLFASARLQPDGTVEITLPDGSVSAGDEQLSKWLGRSVALRSTAQVAARRYEAPQDFEDEDRGWDGWEGGLGAFHDDGQVSVSIVSTATLRGWDRRRFRTNLVVDGRGEDDLVGTAVTVGDTVLQVGQQVHRCVMTTRPQPDGIERDLNVLRTIHRERAGCLGVGAVVLTPGTVHVGDALDPVHGGLRARLRALR